MPKQSRQSSKSTLNSRSGGGKEKAEIKLPTFAERKELVRYVQEAARSGNRVSPAAFLPDPPDPSVKRSYFSVNSLEIEPIKVIAEYHRRIWQNGLGEVALAAHKVFHYREAGRQSGVTIDYDKAERQYVFQEKSGQMSHAFECIPARKDSFKSPSHCGVHFVRALQEHQVGKFARRMSGGKFHLV